MSGLDETHDPELRSWVAGADGNADFPIQNLPLGVVTPTGRPPRAAVAIGDHALDLPALAAAGLLQGEARRAVEVLVRPRLNEMMALGAGPRQALRARLSALLAEGSPERASVEGCLHALAACTVGMPAEIGDYTDFYAGIHHAMNVGRLMRPDSPLPPNYKHVPIGYHGRASSVRPSGFPVRRPKGQTKPSDAANPSFGPCRRLDYELELGIWVGSGNDLGDYIPIDKAADHIAGYCLLNDWSARDIQAWEYQPLGPFLAKSFATTISPWIVTPEAVAPFRKPLASRSAGDPKPLPHLFAPSDIECGALSIALRVLLSTGQMRRDGVPPEAIALSHTRHMYWTPAQLVAHHASGGCNLRPGDLLGTGTISSAEESGCGSLLEATQGGREPVRLQTGEERRFLEDGDEVILQARCEAVGRASIGFGECRAVVLPASPLR